VGGAERREFGGPKRQGVEDQMTKRPKVQKTKSPKDQKSKRPNDQKTKDQKTKRPKVQEYKNTRDPGALSEIEYISLSFRIFKLSPQAKYNFSGPGSE
jgi:hypothetical protein